MCGICGYFDFFKHAPLEGTIARMTESLSHRGPDDSGVFQDGVVALGHTRLSIIDLSTNGHQPMQTPDGRLTLVYNGEIYNFLELKKELAAEGCSFKGHSDTEVVLQAYRRWGREAFHRFNGMFALALWDRDENRLILARDRFGIKPLYYYKDRNNGVVFGSEIKALLASGGVPRAMNPQGLHEYLYYGSALGESTLFQGIHKLLPGHFLDIQKGRAVLARFADHCEVQTSNESLEEAVQGVRQRLDRAVSSHLVSDVPVGVFLSGGVDSSTITALASRHYQGRLKTFSVGFDFDQGINELPKARLVADHFGTEHHELHVVARNVSSVIERLVRCHDEPFGDAADIPLYLLCEELRGSVKVVLQGDGGDEIFAGYRRYNILSQEMGWQKLSRVGSHFGRFFPKTPWNYRQMRFFSAVGHPDPAMRMALLMTEETLSTPPTRVLSQDFRQSLEGCDPFLRYREMHQRFKSLDAVQRMLFTDCNIILPDVFLEKVDKATMAHGIEVRVPLLDNDLCSYVMGLPASKKVRWGQKKWLLRRAMKGIVPDNILNGKKTGFSVPYSYWLRGPLVGYLKSVLLDKETDQWKVFDKFELEKCINEHVMQIRNNGYILYKLLNLVLWKKYYL